MSLIVQRQSSADNVTIQPDAVFGLLSNGRRRFVIRALADTDGELTQRELVDALTVHEHGTQYTTGERNSVFVGLYQSHLPKLVDKDAIDTDGRDTYTANPTTHYLDQIRAAVATTTRGDSA